MGKSFQPKMRRRRHPAPLSAMRGLRRDPGLSAPQSARQAPQPFRERTEADTQAILDAERRRRTRQAKRAPERIAAAACIYRGEVVTLPPPARHHTIIHHVAALHPEDDKRPIIHGGADQGFVTNTGRYIEREEAGRIALAAGQTAALKWGPPLYSEDLW